MPDSSSSRSAPAHRDRKKLRDYDGNDDIMDYLKHFDSVHRYNEWDGWDAAQQLEMALNKEAMKAWNDAQQPCTLENLKKVLIDRFDPSGYKNLHISEFKNLRRKEEETFTEFGARLNRLGNKAYDNIDPKGREALIVDRFLDSLDTDMQKTVRMHIRDNPKMGMAMQLATECEAIEKTSRSQLVPKPKVYDVCNVTTENPLNQLTQQISQLCQQMTWNQQNQPRGNSGQRQNRRFTGNCYYCNIVGHRKIHCQQYQEDVAAGRAPPPKNRQNQFATQNPVAAQNPFAAQNQFATQNQFTAQSNQCSALPNQSVAMQANPSSATQPSVTQNQKPVQTGQQNAQQMHDKTVSFAPLPYVSRDVNMIGQSFGSSAEIENFNPLGTP